MELSSEAFGHQLIATIVFGYIAFCFLYGYSSLRSRRAAATQAAADPDAPRASIKDGVRQSGFVLKVSLSFLVPVAIVASFLSLTGRERSGIVEPHNLFVVSKRDNAIASFIASEGMIKKNQLVVGFKSDALGHRLSALRARRSELIADREAIKLGALPIVSDLMRDMQSHRQKASRAKQRLTELDRATFSAKRHIMTGRIAWQTARRESISQIPIQQRAFDLRRKEFNAASVRLMRIKALRAKQYATISQLEKAEHAKALAENRVDLAASILEKTKHNIESLDRDHNQAEQLLKDRLERLAAEKGREQEERDSANRTLVEMKLAVKADKNQAIARRKQEIAAATSRIAKLDDEMAVVVANTQVKSPIDGRVIYRGSGGASLRGGHPLAVVAAAHGFVLRVSLMRDELPALAKDVREGREVRVVIQDESTKRIVKADLIKTEVDTLDQKRVRVTFGLELPEDMLVRMALKGTTPKGHLEWRPASSSLIAARMAQLFGTALSEGLVKVAAKISQLPVIFVNKTDDLPDPEMISL